MSDGKTLKVLVASTNPNKIEGARKAFLWFIKAASLNTKLQIETQKMPSAVSAQPIGFYETSLGAYNRALNAKKLHSDKDFDYFVGLESGIVFINNLLHTITFACVMNKEGRFFFGTSMAFPLPETVKEYLACGKELADFAADISKTEDIRSKQGIVGFLSNGATSRLFINKTAVKGALVGFIKHNLYLYTQTVTFHKPIVYVSVSISAGLVKEIPLIIADVINDVGGIINDPHVIYAGQNKKLSDKHFKETAKQIFGRLPDFNNLKDLSTTVYQLDTYLVDQATHLIIVLDNPSFGVGMELERALSKPARGLPETKILGLIHKDKYQKLSKMVIGAQGRGFRIKKYKSISEIKKIVKSFLTTKNI